MTIRANDDGFVEAIARQVQRTLEQSPLTLSIVAFALAACAGSGATGPASQPAGEAPTAKTSVLEAGATALQRDAPPDALDIYLVGFHPMKKSPHHQTEAHHFCRQVNQDFAQCALFDGNTAQANLTGIEYITRSGFSRRFPAPRSSTGIHITARFSPASSSRPACRRRRRKS